MGTLAAIPSTVNLVAIANLSTGGRVLARALQNYGAYLVDASEYFVFYAEPSAEGHPMLLQMRADAGRLQDVSY